MIEFLHYNFTSDVARTSYSKLSTKNWNKIPDLVIEDTIEIFLRWWAKNPKDKIQLIQV